MPTYEYACEQCGRHFDVVQSFSEDPLTTCEECGGSLRKVFSSVGIVFKGSGFYKNDARSSSSSSVAPASNDSSSSTSSTSTATSSSSSNASDSSAS